MPTSWRALSRELGTDKAAFVAADVTDAAQTRKYVDETVARWGKIDVLFSNAGNDGPLMPITEYPEDLFDKIIATHVRGCFLACKYTIPQMNDGGSIIITASIVGVKGVPGNCSYVAAKHALMGLMRCVAREVAVRRIRVNSVNPGPVDNRVHAHGREDDEQDPRPRRRRVVRRADSARPPCACRTRSRRPCVFSPPTAPAIPAARR